MVKSRIGRPLAVLLVASGMACTTTGSALAAEQQLGSSTLAPTACSGGSTLYASGVQITQPSRITSFTRTAGALPQTLRFVLLRPALDKLVVAEVSAPVNEPGDAQPHTYPVSMRAVPGDRIGVYTAGALLQACGTLTKAGTVTKAAGDGAPDRYEVLTPGTVRGGTSLKLNLAATATTLPNPCGAETTTLFQRYAVRRVVGEPYFAAAAAQRAARAAVIASPTDANKAAFEQAKARTAAARATFVAARVAAEDARTARSTCCVAFQRARGR